GLPAGEGQGRQGRADLFGDAGVVGEGQVGQQRLGGAGRPAQAEQAGGGDGQVGRLAALEAPQALPRVLGGDRVGEAVGRVAQRGQGGGAARHEGGRGPGADLGGGVAQLAGEGLQLRRLDREPRALAEELQQGRRVRGQAGGAQGLFVVGGLQVDFRGGGAARAGRGDDGPHHPERPVHGAGLCERGGRESPGHGGAGPGTPRVAV